MTFFTKIALARQAKVLTGTTASLEGSISLGENLIVGESVFLPGLQISTGTTYNHLVIDDDGKVFSSTDTGGGGSEFYGGASPATRDLNGIAVGDVLTGRTYDDILGAILAPYTLPTITLNSLSPSGQSNFNQTGITYNISYKWVKNPGTSDFISGLIQYQRTGDGGWTDILPTTISPAAFPPTPQHIASASITLNGAVNNLDVRFRVVFVDEGKTNISSITISGFKTYTPPTVVLGLSVSPTLTGGKLLRNLITTYAGTISGTITRTSPNINLNNYKLQSSYVGDDSAWGDITGLRTLPDAGGTLASSGGNVVDTVTLKDKNFVRYRIFSYDTHVPTGQGIQTPIQLNVYQPVFYGMVVSDLIADIDVSALTVVPNGTGEGQSNYNNTSSDKVINKLVFTASTNRYCFGYDASYSVLTKFENFATTTNLIDSFIVGTKNVSFADGTTKLYRFYIYNSSVLSGTYQMNIL